MKKIYSISTVAIVGLALVSTAKAGVGYDNDFPVVESSLNPPTVYDTDGPEYYIVYNGTSSTVLMADQMVGAGFTGTFPTGDQGPFDGSDDTYIGVINTSAGTVLNSLKVSSTLDIFGFDGDGIDAGLADGGTPVASPDSTGYGGPLGSFSGISSAGGVNTGTVSFAGGIAPGGTTFFSLEEALNSAGGSGTPITVSSAPDAGSSMALLTGSLLGLGALRRRFSK